MSRHPEKAIPKKIKTAIQEGRYLYFYKDIYYFKTAQKGLFRRYAQFEEVEFYFDETQQSGIIVLADVFSAQFRECFDHIVPQGFKLFTTKKDAYTLVMYDITFPKGIPTPQKIAHIKYALDKFYMTDVDFKFTVLMPHAIDNMPEFWVPIIEE